MSKRDYSTGTKNDGSDYCYYYLNTKHELVYKPKGYNIDALENSDDVVVWWRINIDTLDDAYKMLVRAFIKGGDQAMIKALANGWKFDDSFCREQVKKERLQSAHEDNYWHVFALTNIAVRGKGFTLFEAVCNYYEAALQLV